jgi:hypothetical protein
VVQSDFAAELKSGAVTWKMLNYEESAAADLAKKFEIQVPVVVLAKMQRGEIAQWKRLDRVWALVNDKPAYASYVRDEIRQLVRPAESQPDLAVSADKPAAKAPVPESADIPVPADLPIPE